MERNICLGRELQTRKLRTLLLMLAGILVLQLVNYGTNLHLKQLPHLFMFYVKKIINAYESCVNKKRCIINS